MSFRGRIKKFSHVKPMFERDKWRILRGDKVKIITGKDRGEVGIVSKVIRNVRFPRVIVEGRNLVRNTLSMLICKSVAASGVKILPIARY